MSVMYGLIVVEPCIYYQHIISHIQVLIDTNFNIPVSQYAFLIVVMDCLLSYRTRPSSLKLHVY
jgi:hypothetical protein